MLLRCFIACCANSAATVLTLRRRRLCGDYAATVRRPWSVRRLCGVCAASVSVLRHAASVLCFAALARLCCSLTTTWVVDTAYLAGYLLVLLICGSLSFFQHFNVWKRIVVFLLKELKFKIIVKLNTSSHSILINLRACVPSEPLIHVILSNYKICVHATVWFGKNYQSDSTKHQRSGYLSALPT